MFYWLILLLGLGSELSASHLQSVLYYLSHTSSSTYFGDGVLKRYSSGLASNPDPPNLSLPSGLGLQAQGHWCLA
jgi:hypothetical protein